MKRLVLLVAVLAFICLLAGTAFGDILNVPTAEYPTIQAGIDAASSGDTVEVAAGTYYENITMKSGVVIQGAGQGVSIIDGGENGSVVTANGVDSAATLDGFTITNGNAATNGGGMYNENSSPTVTNCTFSGNSAGIIPSIGEGAGMYNHNNSSPTVTNCTFTGNTSNNNGGGMSNTSNSSPEVTNCTFTGNSAHARGGGMYNSSSSPTVINCTFSENTTSASAGWGAGMSNEGSSPTVSKCSFFNNHSGIFGGGMSNYSNSSPIVTSCIFLGNWAQDRGGGMSNYSNSSPIVTSCIFLGNWAQHRGGGIYNYNSSPTVTNCTFSKNYGGMAVIENESNSSVTVTNSILWGDDSLVEILNYDTSSCSVTYSDIDAGGGTYPGTGNIDADPLFVDPDGPDNISGNEDDDYHLSAGSPCIDTGTTSGAPDTDLEGNPRPQGAGYDMGAYEFQLAKTTAMPGILLLLGD